LNNPSVHYTHHNRFRAKTRMHQAEETLRPERYGSRPIPLSSQRENVCLIIAHSIVREVEIDHYKAKKPLISILEVEGFRLFMRSP
jgi:hypothetical protein